MFESTTLRYAKFIDGVKKTDDVLYGQSPFTPMRSMIENMAKKHGSNYTVSVSYRNLKAPECDETQVTNFSMESLKDVLSSGNTVIVRLKTVNPFFTE